MFPSRGRTDVPTIVDWNMAGKIEIHPLVKSLLKLKDINKGFEMMRGARGFVAWSSIGAAVETGS